MPRKKDKTQHCSMVIIIIIKIIIIIIIIIFYYCMKLLCCKNNKCKVYTKFGVWGWCNLYLAFKIYTDPKWKLNIMFKSIYIDDKSIGVNFFGHRIFNALSLSLKNLFDEDHNCIIFMNKFSREGSKWKFLKTIKTVTQILETRNYWLRA